MEVLTLNKIKSCTQSDRSHIVDFNSSTTLEFVFFWKQYGKVDYYGKLPRPFFRVLIENQFQIDGIVNDSSIRLTIISHNKEETINLFLKIVSQYRG